MIPSLILLALLFVVGLVLWLHDRRTRGRDSDGNLLPAQVNIPDQTCSDDCCGTHDVCPSEQILNAELKRDITYYDDEELDAFAGRDSNSYSEAEIEQFRDVLYTLLPADRIGWERSLKRRGVALPQPLREELIMLLSENTTP